ncbi:VOC family protein [Arthrobacter sp.]|uniref:VOC family protein n=1 Tax=Arthrobacter sp. TaxID=1667 RepID=UPI003A8F7EE9
MERVTGIGGFFFRAEDPEALADWYASMLGADRVPLSMEDQPWTQEGGATAFAPMGRETTMLGDASRSWSINFRVRDLTAMVAQLRSADVEVEVDPEAYAMGRFASLADPEGNVVQLWEPAVGEK